VQPGDRVSAPCTLYTHDVVRVPAGAVGVFRKYAALSFGGEPAGVVLAKVDFPQGRVVVNARVLAVLPQE
jgi:hypothetical protein